MKNLILLAGVCLITGCAGLGNPFGALSSAIRAKVNSKVTVFIKAQTVYGPVTFFRDNSTNTVVISPDGTITINPVK